MFSDTIKPVEPKPLSSGSMLSTTHSNGAEPTAETDVFRDQNRQSSSPKADDDTMSNPAGTTHTSDGTTNSPNEAKCETPSEESGEKTDSEIVVDQDRVDIEDSTDNIGKEVQPPVCDSSSEPKLDGEVEAAKASCDTEEESFVVGDKVAIKVSENTLKELQDNFGGCTEGMTKVTMQRASIILYIHF